VCGRNAANTQEAADRLGWDGIETDWKKLLTRSDIDIIDICTPGDSHAEIAIAALNAGKHVICEKPLANTVAEAELMVAAANANKNVKNMVAFNYRRVPAVSLAKKMISEGKLGRIFHIRARYLQDWIVDPNFPLVWRLEKDKAGSGALGDIGAHAIDTTQFVTGQKLIGVSGLTETFIKERPLPGDYSGLQASASGNKMGKVTVDDAAIFVGRTDGGALATYEATRFATGSKNDMGFEIFGSKGSLKFSFEDMNELWYFDNTEGAETAGFQRILVTESVHPYMTAWWPPGHIIGYEHPFTHEIKDFVESVVNNTNPEPSFADGLQVQKVLEAVEKSSANNGTFQTIK
jgi:predicted dehydrogenase